MIVTVVAGWVMKGMSREKYVAAFHNIVLTLTRKPNGTLNNTIFCELI